MTPNSLQLAGWENHQLEKVMDSIIDYRGKTPTKQPHGIPLVTAKIIKNGRIDDPSEYIAEEDYDQWMRRGIPKESDVVITTEAPLGEVAQLDGRKIALAQRVITLRGKADILNNTFLRYLMQSSGVQHQLETRASGTTVLGIKQSELRKILLPIPPLPEQKAIAHILGTLDDKIELNRQTNKTLESIARAIFKSWFVDFDPVRAKRDGKTADLSLSPEILDLFPDSFRDSELGEIPVGWAVKPILEQATLLSGGTPKTNNPEFWGGEIPWASAKDVSQCGETFLLEPDKYITQKGLEGSSTKIIDRYSTVIVARGATTGRLVMFGEDIAMNQTCYGLKSKFETPFYLNCLALLTVDTLLNSAHGSVFDTITTKTFESTNVLYPSPETAKLFEKYVSSLYLSVLNNQRESSTLGQIRDTLLPKLISGELRIKDAEHFLKDAPL